MFYLNGVIFCLAYIIGLLSTAIPWGGYGLLAVGIFVAITMPRWWGGPRPRVWLVAGIVGFLATFYLQVRTPQPANNDISLFATDSDRQEIVTVQGRIASMPRLTRSQRGQFFLEAIELDKVRSDKGLIDKTKKVTGKLYVTVPLLQTTGLHPNQLISVDGILYKPKSAVNPGSFDFRLFLKREGSFAGLSGRQVYALDEPEKPHWSGWAVGAQIVRTQIRWLGSPEGPLVSSMVLGSQAVDLPYDIRDLFIKVGLSHALAASGFQTALILGLVLTLTRRFTLTVQVICGAAALVIFLALTGLQPPVLRAVVMGFGALIALAMNRKVRVLGSLLLAATLLLLFNPLWIWDLGFQMSFLATLGLIVTVPPIIKQLNWLPSAIACLIAVPIAAALWTLPLQLHLFGVVPIYGVLVNILTTPLITIISVGGVFSAIAALFWSWAGSGLAWLLYYPTHWLIELVQFFAALPGNSIAVGTTSVLQLLAVYGLISLAWLHRWWQQRWWLAGVLATALVVTPVWHQANIFRVTVLATVEPILVIQDHGKVLLVNAGDAKTTRFALLPFLQQQGVNQINWAIATNAQSSNSSDWSEILEHVPIKNFYVHPILSKTLPADSFSYQLLSDSQVVTGSTSVQIISKQAPLLQLQIQGQKWLLLGLNSTQQKKLTATKRLPRAQVLWWTGEALSDDLLEAIKPEVVIASSPSLDPATVSKLRKRQIQLFWTRRDGAIQWTPDGKFETTMDVAYNNA